MPVGDGRSVLHGEIFEQPAAVARLLERERRNAAALAALWRRANVPFVLIAARGTSDNAARYAQYAFGLASRLPVALAAPSLVTLYGVPPRLRGALVIGISQSGRSPDIVETLAAARRAGSPTLAIVNDDESPLARAAMRTNGMSARRQRAASTAAFRLSRSRRRATAAGCSRISPWSTERAPSGGIVRC